MRYNDYIRPIRFVPFLELFPAASRYGQIRESRRQALILSRYQRNPFALSGVNKLAVFSTRAFPWNSHYIIHVTLTVAFDRRKRAFPLFSCLDWIRSTEA